MLSVLSYNKTSSIKLPLEEDSEPNRDTQSSLKGPPASSQPHFLLTFIFSPPTTMIFLFFAHLRKVFTNVSEW